MAGGGEEENTTVHVAQSGMDLTRIGCSDTPELSINGAGRISEVGVWDTDISDLQLSMLAKGYSPLEVARANLVEYMPVVYRSTDDIGLVSGLTYSRVGNGDPTHAPHSPRPAPRLVGQGSGVAGSLSPA